MTYKYTNNASTTLASGISAGATTVTVATGTGALFPVLGGSDIFKACLADIGTGTLLEIVNVTATAGDTFTIQRGQEGTTARAYNAGDSISLRPTAAQFGDFFSKTYDTFPISTGSLLNIQTFSASGTYTPTAGTNSIIFHLVGAGGGGGGVPAAPSNNVAGASGGSGGAVAIHRATSGFSGQMVTIGTGGSGGAAGANAGSSGGSSSFMGVVAGGGPGGGAGTATSNSGQYTSPLVAGSSATGGNIANIPGGVGGVGINNGGFSGQGGTGGGNMYAQSPQATAANGSSRAGTPGMNYGGGGCGAVSCGPGVPGTAQAGGTGANGYCIIYEYK